MSTLFLGNHVQFFDDDGVPLSGGEVDFYEVGTSDRKDVYTDSGLTTPASNPVTLDSAGRAQIWLNGDYKARVKASDGTAIRTTDGINPPIDTETSGGNLIANGSFETQGNAATDASGWTLTAQSDGSVERVTTDNYDGEACLKFTSDGSGGGQADTNAFFPVSPGRAYEVSFALKCSVADIRNIIQVRYFDKDQVFLAASSVYDEDTANPTAWTIKQFSETPPANARFAKVRILGADQSDATAGEAKFDGVRVSGSGSAARFPNVDADVTATDEELNKLDGVTATTAELNKLDGIGAILSGQNNGPIYFGWVDVSVPEIVVGPSGWTVTKDATGRFIINHSLNLSSLRNIIASINVLQVAADVTGFGNYVPDGSSDKNNATIYTSDDDGITQDRDFQFIFINTEET